MANNKQKSGNRANLASWLWIAAAGGFLVGSLVLLALILSSGDARRLSALEAGQRIEFSPVTGNVQGRLISLADLEEPPASQEPETGEEIPLPDINEGQAVPTPADDSETEEPPQEAAQETAETTEDTSTTPPAQPPGIAAGEGRDPVQFRTQTGILPGIAKDGTTPWQFYARPKPGTTHPQVVIVLSGLGLGSLATEAALALPAGVTLSFSPYSRDLEKWITRARSSGHEILLDLPLETDRYPAMDPGPLGILAAMSAADSYQNLLSIMERAEGYVGFLMPLGEAVSANENAIASLVDAASKHGLLLLSSQREPGRTFSQASKLASAPILHADILLDERITEAHISEKLAGLEALARKQGFVIAVGRSFPITVELVGKWARGLAAKNLTLVPLTALAQPE